MTSNHISPPLHRPLNPRFSCGPTRKRPGWRIANLESALLGRSHRSKEGKERLRYCLDLMRKLLALPEGYRIAIVPGSDTGAFEMALWSLLGDRGVDVFAWDAFGQVWMTDVLEQLQLDDLRVYDAPYGRLPDLSVINDERDIVLTWNGTASGVLLPDDAWLNPERKGLVIADATSAVFAVPVPIECLDVVTFSWQKSLGGEAAHGVLILSPKAVQRLETYTPPWPLPKLFRMTQNGKLNEKIFTGQVINTPSMLVVEDAIDSLEWVEEQGGLGVMHERVKRNFNVINNWIMRRDDLEFMAELEETISPVSVTIKIKADWFTKEDEAQQREHIQVLLEMLEAEQVAYDIGGYLKAPPSLRIWCGPMIETTDLEALTPWIDWALDTLAAKF